MVFAICDCDIALSAPQEISFDERDPGGPRPGPSVVARPDIPPQGGPPANTPVRGRRHTREQSEDGVESSHDAAGQHHRGTNALRTHRRGSAVSDRLLAALLRAWWHVVLVAIACRIAPVVWTATALRQFYLLTGDLSSSRIASAGVHLMYVVSFLRQNRRHETRRFLPAQPLRFTTTDHFWSQGFFLRLPCFVPLPPFRDGLPHSNPRIDFEERCSRFGTERYAISLTSVSAMG